MSDEYGMRVYEGHQWISVDQWIALIGFCMGFSGLVGVTGISGDRLAMLSIFVVLIRKGILPGTGMK